jgi:hypothetical protein
MITVEQGHTLQVYPPRVRQYIYETPNTPLTRTINALDSDKISDGKWQIQSTTGYDTIFSLQWPVMSDLKYPSIDFELLDGSTLTVNQQYFSDTGSYWICANGTRKRDTQNGGDISDLILRVSDIYQTPGGEWYASGGTLFFYNFYNRWLVEDYFGYQIKLAGAPQEMRDYAYEVRQIQQ